MISDQQLHYSVLAKGLKKSVELDPHVLDAERLASYTGICFSLTSSVIVTLSIENNQFDSLFKAAQDVRKLIQWDRELPLEEKRKEIINEVGFGLLKNYSGMAKNLVLSANGSASVLVEQIVNNFPGLGLKFRGL